MKTLLFACITFPLLPSAQQNMKIKAISAEELLRPSASYSHALVVDNLVFVAGQAGVDFSTGKTDPDFEKQARQAFDNLKKVLESSGSDMSRVVKTTVWLKDARDFEKLNALYKEYFPKNPPARSTPIVDLPRPEFKISIEAVAVVKQ